jgi:hypothetical protein
MLFTIASSVAIQYGVGYSSTDKRVLSYVKAIEVRYSTAVGDGWC